MSIGCSRSLRHSVERSTPSSLAASPLRPPVRRSASRSRARSVVSACPAIEVRAHTAITLNGRAPAPLIDPNVDLAKVERSV